MTRLVIFCVNLKLRRDASLDSSSVLSYIIKKLNASKLSAAANHANVTHARQRRHKQGVNTRRIDSLTDAREMIRSALPDCCSLSAMATAAAARLGLLREFVTN